MGGHIDRSFNFALWPEEPIFIDYHSARHERESRPLLERLASILGYEIQNEPAVDLD